MQLASVLFISSLIAYAEAQGSPTRDPQYTLITDAPRLESALEKRQGAGADLIGWYSSSVYWYPYTCPLHSYYAAGPRFGACCPIGEQFCNPLVACEGNVGVHSNGVRADCGTEICDTVTIFNSKDVPATGIHSLVACFSTQHFYEFPRVYYRATYALTTTSSSRTPSTVMATRTVTQTASKGLGLTRWYIDMREHTQTTTALPLINTLQASDQKKIRAFFRVADQHMSLASCLLKYLYIHRILRVPWNQIIISRTPQPHSRPCYTPLKEAYKDGESATSLQIEFNVSHQASMVALVGCSFPTGLGASYAHSSLEPSSQCGLDGPPQVGVDITCTDEREKRSPDSIPTTEKEFCEFVDIFTEAFSAGELNIIKTDTSGVKLSPTDTPSERLAKSIYYRTRLFYTYWALKEAYIKMVGEGLLAGWLQKLEFSNVVAPEPEGHHDWGVPKTDIEIRLSGKVVDNVRMEVVSFGDRYILATATRGGGFEKSSDSAQWEDFKPVDIENDIKSCAIGECDCLSK